MRQTMRITPPLHTFCPPVCRLQDAAWNYAHNGWRILPLYSLNSDGTCACGQLQCPQPGQHPYLVDDVQQATNDALMLQHWWKQDEQANIGIATGDGLVVIEIDPLRGGFLEHFRQLYAIPETAISQTERGSWQLYFIYNRTLTLCTTKNKLGPGIDTYGEGNYVVAPPSLYIHGRVNWINTATPARLPAVLLPFLLSSHLYGPAWSTRQQRPSPAARELARLLLQRSIIPEQEAN
ncbi:bifunctional DNA primase/polymerase [Dictyobacter aurantiacus]|uniref:DNA primase/polymerase bifunctional N-terminal domain-containing protein n=1 Tax=Dictyobacter aurantiacus TaxID=1936993 RepID=A0A401ZD45_9CHLR|nr:bifunctional DNA primase/polymerase [Dictyobacter aurantiacus]GCE04810.1 hypothetical protein KDAU_21390 [Dictyobacter aurantiacus]